MKLSFTSLLNVFHLSVDNNKMVTKGSERCSSFAMRRISPQMNWNKYITVELNLLKQAGAMKISSSQRYFQPFRVSFYRV